MRMYVPRMSITQLHALHLIYIKNYSELTKLSHFWTIAQSQMFRVPEELQLCAGTMQDGMIKQKKKRLCAELLTKQPTV